LNYIQAAIYSLVLRYNSAHEKVLLINLEKYLELTFSQIKNWTSLFKQNLLRMKTLFSAIQICATIISFLNSRAALIGSLVKLGFGVLDKI